MVSKDTQKSSPGKNSKATKAQRKKDWKKNRPPQPDPHTVYTLKLVLWRGDITVANTETEDIVRAFGMWGMVTLPVFMVALQHLLDGGYVTYFNGSYSFRKW